MSQVLSEISDDYKFLYFTCSHDKEVNIGEQNHQSQILSAGSDMDFKLNFKKNSSLLNVQRRGRVPNFGKSPRFIIFSSSQECCPLPSSIN